MKQTLEEAAKENILFNHRTVDRTLSGKDLAKFGEMNFVQGAEWQAKQSPWISVKDKAGCDSSNDCIVIDTNGDIFKAYFSSKNEWVKYNCGYYDEVIKDVTHWMPIPSFDGILKANRDVLERVKEKGD